jgi:CubicO group peptidase (beta-lactamase class C family)
MVLNNIKVIITNTVASLTGLIIFLFVLLLCGQTRSVLAGVSQSVNPKLMVNSPCTWRSKRHQATRAKCTILKRNKNPIKLRRNNELSELDKKTIEESKLYMTKSDGPLGLLLIKKGAIISEKYAGLGNKKSRFSSFSIAKSLTGLSVGKAICNGLFELNTPAVNIVPEFKVNNYGISTVRQILMMSSGAYWTTYVGWGTLSTGGYGKRWKGTLKGQPIKAPDSLVTAGQITFSEVLWGKYWDLMEQKNVAKPGDHFVYKGMDSVALSKIVERASGMSLGAYFDKEVWQSIKPGRKAFWRGDIEGSTMGNSGFNASLRDWGRLAIWILAERKKSSCFGNYLKEATSKQIDNKKIAGSNRSGPTFKGYGYQFWVENRRFYGFCGKGFAGQWFCMDPKTEKILIKFSYKITPGLSDIFNKWNAE